MAHLTRRTTGVLVAAGVLAIASSTIAQTATQADIDACNKMAEASTALSRGSTSGASEATHPGGLESNRQRNSGGRLSPSAGSPGTNAGPSGISGSGDSPSASPRTSAADSRLNGMAATGHGIAAYQQSYRDCMKERGF
jgi:hypothetical protein